MNDERFASSLSPEELEKRAQRQRERQLKALADLSAASSRGAEDGGIEEEGGDEVLSPAVMEALAFLQGDIGLPTTTDALAPFESKWRFTFSELQSAVKVVSTLFGNPSLFLGDPYLAESRLYTMITRDRRSKKENREAFKQIMNEEKRRRDKAKRAQDLETIKKTTMKREREEALNQLLLAGDDEGNDDDEDGRGNRAQQLLIQQRQLRMQPSTPLAITAGGINNEKLSSAEVSKCSVAEKVLHKRAIAAFELLEVIFDVSSLHAEGLMVEEGTKRLTPQQAQDWRCHLTAAFHRYIPTLPFGTQMVHCLPVADFHGQEHELIPTWAPHAHTVLQAAQRLLLSLRVFAAKSTEEVAGRGMLVSEFDCVKQLSLCLKERLLPRTHYRSGGAEGDEGMGVPAQSIAEIFSSWRGMPGQSTSDDKQALYFAVGAASAPLLERAAARLSNGSLFQCVLKANIRSPSGGAANRPIISASSLRMGLLSALLRRENAVDADVSLGRLLSNVGSQCCQLLDSRALMSHGSVASVCVASLSVLIPEILAAHTITAASLGQLLMQLTTLLTVVTQTHAQHLEDTLRCDLDDCAEERSVDPARAYLQGLGDAHTRDEQLFIGSAMRQSPPKCEEGEEPPLRAPPYITLQRLSDTTVALLGAILYAADDYGSEATITKGLPSLFNGVKLHAPPAAPEADPNGTIPGEEGVFEGDEIVGNVESRHQFPYQDAMLFVTSTGGGGGGAAEKGGTLMMLTRETSAELRMNRVQKCHTCKGKYSFLHPFYYSLCRPCGEFNYNKRLMTRDLTGKVVLLTGCRIKIGYAMALSLLRCGATVIGTTRFSVDAMGRFSEEPDFEAWKHRLHLYTIDLRDMWLVTEFCAYIGSKFPKLFAIINNAAQTIARTAAYTAELRRLEAQPPPRLRERLNTDADATAWYHYYHANSSVIVGRSLTLEHHPVPNPVMQDDLEIDGPTSAGNDCGDAADGAATAGLPKESAEEREMRMRKEGGDGGALTNHLEGNALGAAVAKRYDRYDTYAEESDKRDRNTWTMNMAEVEGSEAAEVMAINALSPFILNAKLKPLLMNRAGEEPEVERGATLSHSARKAGADRAGRYPSSARFIINVSAMEGQFYRHKQTTHPHTNMAKAALNMMTRTSAEDYAKDGIYMNSVDTGWITDESPAEKKKHRAQESMLCPLDEVDAAARCLDLIYSDSREYGKFFKNFITISW